MDSITQGLLGAAVAQVALQSRLGPRAWVYGAVGGMAPYQGRQLAFGLGQPLLIKCETGMLQLNLA